MSCEDSILRILIVDDEEGMRLGMVRVLRRGSVEIPELDCAMSYVLETAADGEEALRKLESFKPDLLLLDYKLPDITGLDVLKAMAEVDSQALTVMITAYATLENAITATKRGAFDFLAKPWSPAELRKVVEKAARHAVLRRRARALEEEKRRVRFEFVSVLAHELKAPIASVESSLYLLRSSDLVADPEVVTQVAERSIRRLGGMRKLIADLLDITHLESGSRERTLEELDLVELAREALETAQGLATERGVSLELQAPAHLSVRADAEELAMIFNNLLSNAVKYNRVGGRVRLRLSREGEGVVLEVQDTGIGMTEEEAERAFGELTRIKNAHTREIPGSGLGLSILRKVVDLYGGSVSVDSTPGQGSTFTVSLDA